MARGQRKINPVNRNCTYCGDPRMHKSGTTSSGHQQYKCFACKRVITPESTIPAQPVYTPEQRAQAIEMARTHTLREVGEVFGVSRNTLCVWRKAANETPKPVGRPFGWSPIHDKLT